MILDGSMSVRGEDMTEGGRGEHGEGAAMKSVESETRLCSTAMNTAK